MDNPVKSKSMPYVTPCSESAYILNYGVVAILVSWGRIMRKESKLMSEGKLIHFVGIGGAGMSGIAKVFLELGEHVSGSDLQASESTKRLKKMGGKIFIGHHENNVDSQVGKVVVSSAIPHNNAEVVKAKQLGIPIVQRAEMLGELMKRQKGIAIAGAHGKTTTTSMISLIFEKNGYDPTVVIGGELNDIGGNAKLGKGKYLIAEADESDGSFLKLKPYVTVVTNIEDDHLDYYGTRENIKKAFQEFISLTDPEGFVVVCMDDPVLSQMMPGLVDEKRIITYGVNTSANISAHNIRLEGFNTKFSVLNDGQELGEIKLSIPGKHNVLNALAAVAVGLNSGLSFEGIAKSLKPFLGAHRRFQKIGEIDGIRVYDDYAHHPTEIKATLSAAKTISAERIVAVFQPHRYTRTKLLAKEFGTAFSDADVLIINEIYSAGEPPIPGVDAEMIVNQIKTATGQPVIYLREKEEIVKRLSEITKPGDIILTLGAGNIWTVAYDLCNMLES